MSQEPKMIINYSHSGLVKRQELAGRMEALEQPSVELLTKHPIKSDIFEKLHPRGPGGTFKVKSKPAKTFGSLNGKITVNGSKDFQDIVVGLATGALNEVLSFASDLPGFSIIEDFIKDHILGLYTFTSKDIIINKDEDWKASTLIHEIGHYLDHNISDIKLSLNPDLLRTFYGSKKIQQIGDAYSKGGSDKGFNAYLLSKEEMFGRAFSQYIVTKSSNKVLKAELKKDNTQWSDKDFIPIGKQLDKMFKDLGMRR